MTRWDVPDAIWESDNSYDVPVLNPRYQADAVDLPFVAWGSVAVYHRKETRQMNKVDILQTWANHLATAAQQGALTGRPCPISRIETVTGPRAGILEIFAGLESGRLLRALSKNHAATLRQFIPWQFTGAPQAFMSGRYVRCEAGWPANLANDVIRLSAISQHPTKYPLDAFSYVYLSKRSGAIKETCPFREPLSSLTDRRVTLKRECAFL